MAERTHSLWHGQSGTPFTVFSRLQITPTAVNMAFETFASVERFDAGDAPIHRMRAGFVLDSDEVAANAELLNTIRQAVLVLVGLGGRNYTVTNFYINTVDKVIEISATSASGGDVRTDSRSGDEYDQTIVDNQTLVGEVLTFAWTYGKTNDEYLAALTAV